MDKILRIVHDDIVHTARDRIRISSGEGAMSPEGIEVACRKKNCGGLAMLFHFFLLQFGKGNIVC